MTYVIKLIAYANGAVCKGAGQFVMSFDHEAFNGRGFIRHSADIERAKQFDDQGAAFQFWRRIPMCKPRREDGQPNRPMTSYTIEILTKEDADGARAKA